MVKVASSLEARNDGIGEATVPIVFVSLLDERADVAFVEHIYVGFAARPQRRLRSPTGFPTSEPRAALPNVQLKIYSQASSMNASLQESPSALLALPDDVSFDSIRIDVGAFIASG